MKDVLVDMSYLTSAYKCIIGKATTEIDLQNFYRFLGEVLSHKKIHINVNQNGPVQEIANKCVAFFSKESAGKFEIEQLNQNNIDYSLISNSISNYLMGMTFESLISVKYSDDIQPKFSSENPDLLFHKWLVNDSPKLPDFISYEFGATYIPFFVAEKIDFHRKFKALKKRNWSVEKSLSVAAKLRTFVYIEIAKKYNLTYIPSSTRAKNSQYFFNEPSLRNILCRDDLKFEDFKKSLLENNNIISSIIFRNRCIPIEIVKDIFFLRNRTEKLRDELYKNPLFVRGDSLLMYKYKKIEDFKKLLEDTTNAHMYKFKFSDFNPTISSDMLQNEIGITLPLGEIISKFLNIGQNKANLKMIEPLLLPVIQTRFHSKNEIISNLRINSGLNA